MAKEWGQVNIKEDHGLRKTTNVGETCKI
jgi:hypothetical protein